MSNENQSPRGLFHSGRNKAVALVAGTAIAVGGAIGVQAATETPTYQHFKLAASSDSWGGHGWHKDGRSHFSELSDEEIRSMVERGAKHLAIEIDATDEQTEKLVNLITAVAMDMRSTRQQWEDAGVAFHTILTQDTIDREALEKLRMERLAEADRVSKNLIAAIADAAEVLTVEQRAVIEERIEQFRSMRGRHRRG